MLAFSFYHLLSRTSAKFAAVLFYKCLMTFDNVLALLYQFLELGQKIGKELVFFFKTCETNISFNK